MSSKPYRSGERWFAHVFGLWVLFGFFAAFLGAQDGVSFFYDVIDTFVALPDREEPLTWLLVNFIWAFAGAALGWFVYELRHRSAVHEWERQEARDSRHQADAVAHAERQRKQADRQREELLAHAERERAQQRLRELPDEIVGTYSQAVMQLKRSARELDSVTAHRQASAFSPFWEGVERGLGLIDEHRESLHRLRNLVLEHQGLLSGPYAGTGETAPQALTYLTETDAGEALTAQYRALVYEAQTDFHFSAIYEQRRTTAAVVAGFASINDAVNQLGDLVHASYEHLGQALRQNPRQGPDLGRVVDAHISPLASSHSLGGQVVEMNRHLEAIVTRFC